MADLWVLKANNTALRPTPYRSRVKSDLAQLDMEDHCNRCFPSHILFLPSLGACTVYPGNTPDSKRLKMGEQPEQVEKSMEAMELDSGTVASSSKSIVCSQLFNLCFQDFD